MTTKSTFLGHMIHRTAAGALCLGFGALFFSAIGVAGCGDDEGTGTGGSGQGGSGGIICEGGIIDEDGNCIAKCDPAKCVANNVCVDNECRLLCEGHDECFPGLQECAPATEDDTGRLVDVCLGNGRVAAPLGGYPQGTYGTACFFGEGDCASQLACPNGLECDPTSCADCTRADDICTEGEDCNVGRCAATGDLCVLNTCSPTECTPFTCITAGEGDAEAYCTHHDCDDDSECPSGFFCGETRDPRDVCNTTKGSANLCGDNVADPCLDPASFMDNGAQFFEGSVCLLRKTCLKREDCNPCTTNLDCSWGQAQVCTTHAGANVCARLCTGAADCKKDETCAPYAAATLGSDKTGFCQDTPGVACGSAEDCGGGACSPVTGTCAQAPGFDCAQDADCVTAGDVCVPRSVCVPSSGACDASDAPGDKFCFHCTKDSDCGDASSSMACVDAGRGQLACLDLAFSTSCMADTDCPAAPSGLRGECLDEQEGVSPSSSVYHRCYFPFDDGEQAFTCW